MYELSTEIYQGKLRALEAGDEAVHEQMSRGKDIMSILMNQNMKASDEDKLSEEELIGQALPEQMSILIFAAMDTTSILVPLDSGKGVKAVNRSGQS
ncbi:hypothetical protein PQX77_011360 [Marasmius sp. AFHP31]|nr:hypothetical protein PQX77_011360 [Marasmius sp. AFHP31]